MTDKLNQEELLRKPIKDHDQMTEHELRTEVLRLRAKVNRLRKKPQVTEEWIEEKVRNMAPWYGFVSQWELNAAEGFIHSLVGEKK